MYRGVVLVSQNFLFLILDFILQVSSINVIKLRMFARIHIFIKIIERIERKEKFVLLSKYCIEYFCISKIFSFFTYIYI